MRTGRGRNRAPSPPRGHGHLATVVASRRFQIPDLYGACMHVRATRAKGRATNLNACECYPQRAARTARGPATQVRRDGHLSPACKVAAGRGTRKASPTQVGVVTEQIRSERRSRARHPATPTVTEPHFRPHRATRYVPTCSSASAFGAKRSHYCRIRLCRSQVRAPAKRCGQLSHRCNSARSRPPSGDRITYCPLLITAITRSTAVTSVGRSPLTRRRSASRPGVELF
jgi:hypothetical protein